MHKVSLILIIVMNFMNSFTQEFHTSYPDLFFEYRIAELNINTPVELDYNEAVRYYIDLYTVHRREEFARIIGLSELYFPFFDEMLAK